MQLRVVCVYVWLKATILLVYVRSLVIKLAFAEFVLPRLMCTYGAFYLHCRFPRWRVCRCRFNFPDDAVELYAERVAKRGLCAQTQVQRYLSGHGSPLYWLDFVSASSEDSSTLRARQGLDTFEGIIDEAAR